MLAAIDFHDKSRVRANKIHDVRPDRNLSPEAPVFKLAAAKAIPKSLFSFGQAGA